MKSNFYDRYKRYRTHDNTDETKAVRYCQRNDLWFRDKNGVIHYQTHLIPKGKMK